MTEALLYIAGVVVMAVGILLSIALHEVGHLVPAKLFGVRVTQYMIGFGKTVFSRTRGETEYGLKAIPLGGYIAMVGMFPPEKKRRGRLFQRPPATVGEAVEEVVEEVERPSRARTASTGFFNTLVQDARTSSAEQIQPGEDGRAFYRLPVWKRIVIMLGGPFVNLLLGILFIGVSLVGFGVYQPTTTVASIAECVVPATQTEQRCTASDPVAPAAGTALRPGDRITAVDGRSTPTWADVLAAVRPAAGRTLELAVTSASGAAKRISVTPAANTIAVVDDRGEAVRNADGSVRTRTVGFIGISPTQVLTPQPVTAVLPTVGTNVVSIAGVIVNLPARMVAVAQAAFGDGERDPNGPVSVVGVGRFAGEIAANQAVPVVAKADIIVGILGSVNIALFVFNLVPLLPLDGGHVAGALWEGLRRRVAKLFHRADPGPVDTAKLMPLTFAVSILLGAMSVLLIYADLVHPIVLS